MDSNFESLHEELAEPMIKNGGQHRELANQWAVPSFVPASFEALATCDTVFATRQIVNGAGSARSAIVVSWTLGFDIVGIGRPARDGDVARGRDGQPDGRSGR